LELIRIELHCHTDCSKDGLIKPEQLPILCQKKGIDRVAVTDHNTITGAVRAQKVDPQRVIIGEEVMTTVGELLAFFVQEEVPVGLPPEEALRRLGEQGAFISVSHPFDRLRCGSWKEEDLLPLLAQLDAFETFNARALWPNANRKAAAFAYRYGLAGTVGSDAHYQGEIGQATLLLPAFRDAQGLRLALPQARIQARISPPWVHLASRYAAWSKGRRQT